MLRWLKRGTVSLMTMLAVLCLAYLAGKGGVSGEREARLATAVVTAYPLKSFRSGHAEQKRFGPLEFMGGLELRSHHPGFGGISAFRFQVDGSRFIAATDVGDWITGIVQRKNGVPAGLDDVRITPIMTTEGKRVRDIGLWDVESLALDSKKAIIGIERQHSVMGFAIEGSTVKNAGKLIPVPEFVKRWPSNRGIEALGFLPQNTPFAGRLIGFSERSSDSQNTSEAFVMKDDGTEAFRFSIRRSDGFDMTDLDFMPNGDLILLQRFFSPIRGVGMRLQRIRTDLIKPEALIEPETLLVVDNSYTIDNMEGISIHRGAVGETLFTITSDDNFSVVQRNLLLQFRWIGD